MQTIENEDVRFMQMALVEARQAASAGEVPVGCVVVAEGRLVGRGHNLTETLQDVTAHAEIQAITAAAGSLGGKISVSMHVVCNRRALCDVCRGYRVGTDHAGGIWNRRPQTRFFGLCSQGVAPQVFGDGGGVGGRMP